MGDIGGGIKKIVFFVDSFLMPFVWVVPNLWLNLKWKLVSVLKKVERMGGCIGINRTTDTETVNGSSTNISRPTSGKFVLCQKFCENLDC